MRIIIIDQHTPASLKLTPEQIKDFELLGEVCPGAEAIAAIDQHNPDIVVMAPQVARDLNAHESQSANKKLYISANTHQGMQLVPITTVYYFQADQKYVVAYHEQGELLLNNSLISLEREFSQDFIKVHRQTLVASSKLQELEKDVDGTWYVKIVGCAKKLPVSRRQLPVVRRFMRKGFR